ncbi:MAG TPA: LPS assembly protein LptD [Candidatus Sulfotelmatobacter sp.]|jgi:LPS-assembly protein|nr:LPS assembly protein LptD [Candidatus Sulfotelmatobacter sp.]
MLPLRFLITALLLCHVLLAPQLVTSQLRPDAEPAQTLPNAPSSGPGVPVRMQSLEQEKDGAIYKLTGHVKVDYETYTIYADRATYNSDTGEVEGEGHLLLEGGPNNEHIEAERGKYNVQKETGRFEAAVGSVGFRLKGRRNVLTTTNPFFFTGRVVEKLGPDHYVVTDGTVTTCELPRPKWMFAAHRVNIEVGGHATIYHSNFRLEGIPILYFPFVTHPVQKNPRESGFLIPSIGRSSTRGDTAGDAIFWAINRSMDVLGGVEYFSKRGWAPDAEFRARPTDNSFVDLTYYSVFDRGINLCTKLNPCTENQGGTEIRLNSEGEFAHNFRSVANIDYLSSYVFRLAFSDVFAQAVDSEVRSEAFLSNTTGSFFINGVTRRYQDFQSTMPGDVITILHAPGGEISSVDRQLWGTPFHGTMDADAEGLSRSEPEFRTAPLVGRFDLNPALSLPRVLRGWSFRPELSLRDTIYTQQLIPASGTELTQVGTAVSNTLNRKSLEGSVEMRPPAIDRIFDREIFGHKWKHVVEPRIVYDYVTGVGDFDRVLRFDERDILSDTNEVEYAVVNRLYAKRTSPEKERCEPEGMPTLIVGGAPAPSHIPWERNPPPPASTAGSPQGSAGESNSQQPNGRGTCSKQPDTREIVSWELAQKYFLDPTFGGALIPGRSNVLTSTVDLTGIAFLTEPRHLSPLISRLRVGTSRGSDLEWDVDYDFLAGRVNSSTFLFNYHVGLFTVGAGDTFLHVPGEITNTSVAPVAEKFNQFRTVLGYGNPSKRGFSMATSLGFDAELGQVQYGSVQTAYNWDCCAVNLEYRRFALASVRNENQYRFTFSLANVGAFGNLRRGERLF